MAINKLNVHIIKHLSEQKSTWLNQTRLWQNVEAIKGLSHDYNGN
jgi:hypothetical protein